jgi:benzoate-CoA ligase family protein
LIHTETYYDERIPRVPEYYNAVSELLDNHIKAGDGDRVAIQYVNPSDREPVERITYSKLYETVNKLGNALRDKLGVGVGERVGILIPDSPYIHYFFLAAMKIGAVPVPMNTFATNAFVKKMISKGEMITLAVDKELLGKVAGESKLAEPLRTAIIVDHKNANYTETQNEKSVSFIDLVNGSSSELEAASVHKNDPCFWFYTSGSTGEPKGVVHAHHDIHYAAYAMYKELVDLKPEDVIFSAAKLFFSAGLGPGLYGPLTFGASSILFPERTYPEVCLQIISKFKPAIFLAVPTVFAKMLSANEGNSYDLSSLRLCITGGEPLPASIYDQWMKKMKVELVEGVGAAEMTHFYTVNRPGKVRPGSGGQLLPGYQIKLVDSAGNPVPEGTIGEFLVRGESSFLGYWNDEEKTRRTILKDGWISTGDLFRVDGDGYYYFCGRQDYAFKASGLWVSPIKIESLIFQDPSVEECAVVPKLTREGITIPVAFLVLRKENLKSTDQQISEIKIRLSENLPKYEVPQEFRLLDKLPKTNVDKVDRKELVAML